MEKKQLTKEEKIAEVKKLVDQKKLPPVGLEKFKEILAKLEEA